MSGKQVWVLSTSEEHRSGDEEFSSKEEAINEAQDILDDEEENGFWVGTKESFHLAPYNSEHFLDSFLEVNLNECGDYSERWSENVQTNKKINSFVDEKMKEICNFIHKECPPDFFVVKNIEAVCVESSKEKV